MKTLFNHTLQALLRQKKTILVPLVLFLALGLIFTFASDPGGQTTVPLLLRFDNINRGYYPDGSPFNKEDLISSAIVRQVVRDLDLNEDGVTVTALRRHLDVVGAMSRGDIREAERLQEEGRSPEAMFPSEYRISILDGEQLGLDESRQQEILLAVVEAYTDRFRRVHSGLESPLPAIYLEKENIQEYDYPLIPDIMTARVDQLLEFLVELEERNRTFRSSELGYSYSDLRRELENTREERVGYIRTIVQESHLTTDPAGTLRRYRVKVDELDEKISRKEQEASFARTVLRELEEDMVDEPLAEGMADVVEILLKHEYHTALLTRSLEAGMEMEELKVDRDFYLSEIARLTGTPPEEDPEGVEEAAGEEAAAEVAAEAAAEEGQQSADQPELEELAELARENQENRENQAGTPASEPSPELIERIDHEIELTLSRIEGYLEIIEDMRREMLEEEAERAVYMLRSPYWQAAGRPPVQQVAAWMFIGLLVGGGLAYYRETVRSSGGYQAPPKGSPDKSEEL